MSNSPRRDRIVKKTTSESTASSPRAGETSDDNGIDAIEQELLEVLATGRTTVPPKPPSQNKSRSVSPCPSSPTKKSSSSGSQRHGSMRHRRRESDGLESPRSREDRSSRSPTKYSKGKLDFIGASDGKSPHADETETTATPTSRMTETTEASHRSSRNRRHGSISSSCRHLPLIFCKGAFF